MSSIKKLLILLLIFFGIISCQKKDNHQKMNLLHQSSWILGNWKNDCKDGFFKEVWVKQNDSLYTANSFIIINKDTVFHEFIDLFQKNDSLCFKAKVVGQNEDQAVSFWLTNFSKNELVFENPKHDFPTKIVYKLVTKDSIIASIHGVNKGKKVDELFPMRRK